jgi:hypothetical protein
MKFNIIVKLLNIMADHEKSTAHLAILGINISTDMESSLICKIKSYPKRYTLSD